MENTQGIPFHVLPERGQYVCPGSIFVPVIGDDRCLCGHPLEAHVWRYVNGVTVRVERNRDDNPTGTEEL